MSADPADLLRARRLRVTPQRRAILGAFRDLPDEHLSADEVHARASAVVPELGRGTVYATLAELTELGLVASVGRADPVRYEINVDPHDHFRCRFCLRLFDVDLDAADPSALPVPEGFLVENVYTTAEGVCADCRAYREGMVDGAASVVAKPQMDDGLLGAVASVRRETPLGTVVLAASTAGAVRLAFEDHADFAALSDRARSRRGGRAAREHADALGETVARYFDGDTQPGSGEVDWGKAEQATTGTLEATRQIPYGGSRSYLRLGVEIEAYRCGYSLGTNPLPLFLPCHRVICGNSRLDAWVGGAERLHQLSAFEADTLSAR
jgi:Fe2+ or Zn2+ uptake regulation protein/O6-methylguanine-DNA--protein-cysteine methyltransferase